MTPEGKVKAKVRKFLDSLDRTWYYMPVARGMGVMGIPDFVGVSHGRFFCIEAKAGTARPTLRQTLILSKITLAGGAVFVINEDNLNELEEMKSWAKH